MSYSSLLINKGTGAGGASTTKNGLNFEEFTSNKNNLESQGYARTDVGKGKTTYYLRKIFSDLNVEVFYASKKGVVLLLNILFGVAIYREPDEAFLVHSLEDDTYNLYIIEVKNQNRSGSVEDKILAGPVMKRTYQMSVGPEIKVHFAYVLSDYLKTKFASSRPKYTHINRVFMEEDIKLFYGGDQDYFVKLFEWIGISPI
jgi:hypothetical protein